MTLNKAVLSVCACVVSIVVLAGLALCSSVIAIENIGFSVASVFYMAIAGIMFGLIAVIIDLLIDTCRLIPHLKRRAGMRQTSRFG